MKVSALRTLQLGCIVVLHVAAVALVLYLLRLPDTEQPWRWPELAAALVLSLFADRLVEGVSRRWRARLWVGAGVTVIALLTKRLLGGGMDPFSGWHVLLSEQRDIQELITDVAALLFMWARGPQVLLLDHGHLAGFFRRAVVGLLLFSTFHTVVLSPLVEPQALATLSGYVVAFVASGLLALGLAHAAEAADRTGQRRWAISMLLPIMGLLLIGIAGTSIVSPALRQVVVAVVNVLLLGIGLLLAPFTLLLSPLINALRALVPPVTLPSPSASGSPAPSPVPQADALVLPPWVTLALRGVVLLVLVLIAVLVLRWLSRRVRRSHPQREEERSSVWSWQAFGEDLRGLLAALLAGRQRRAGLLAALSALRDRDAATRIRRAYIRLLLLAEDREQRRVPSQTPREYEPAAEQLVPHARSSVALLTGVYEQARYGPSPVAEQADAAEQAWQEIERDVKRNRR
jgi:Na+-transporting methylmalonyl-CoA/oxaloacetate decarboxylase gamma subunit